MRIMQTWPTSSTNRLKLVGSKIALVTFADLSQNHLIVVCAGSLLWARLTCLAWSKSNMWLSLFSKSSRSNAPFSKHDTVCFPLSQLCLYHSTVMVIVSPLKPNGPNWTKCKQSMLQTYQCLGQWNDAGWFVSSITFLMIHWPDKHVPLVLIQFSPLNIPVSQIVNRFILAWVLLAPHLWPPPPPIVHTGICLCTHIYVLWPKVFCIFPPFLILFPRTVYCRKHFV